MIFVWVPFGTHMTVRGPIAESLSEFFFAKDEMGVMERPAFNRVIADNLQEIIEPEIETEVGMQANDPCCQEAKRAIAQQMISHGPTDKYRQEDLDRIEAGVMEMDCEELRQRLEDGIGNPFSDEILQIWDSCSSREFGGDFTASSDSAFDRGWDAVMKDDPLDPTKDPNSEHYNPYADDIDEEEGSGAYTECVFGGKDCTFIATTQNEHGKPMCANCREMSKRNKRKGMSPFEMQQQGRSSQAGRRWDPHEQRRGHNVKTSEESDEETRARMLREKRAKDMEELNRCCNEAKAEWKAQVARLIPEEETVQHTMDMDCDEFRNMLEMYAYDNEPGESPELKAVAQFCLDTWDSCAEKPKPIDMGGIHGSPPYNELTSDDDDDLFIASLDDPFDFVWDFSIRKRRF